MTFTEIPLNGLRFNFTVTLADNTSLSFPGSYVGVDDPQGYLFKLTIKLDQQDGLIRFYKFISNGVNASYCSIQITASYFGYTQKPGASTSPIYRPMLFRSDLQSVGAPGRVATARFVWPGRPVAPVANETPDYITNDAMSFAKAVLNVNFDCHQFPNNYLTKTGDNSISIFACKPPFGDSSLERNEVQQSSFNKWLACRHWRERCVYKRLQRKVSGNTRTIPNCARRNRWKHTYSECLSLH